MGPVCSEPFPMSVKGDGSNNSTYFMGLCRFNELMCIKHLEQYRSERCPHPDAPKL